MPPDTPCSTRSRTSRSSRRRPNASASARTCSTSGCAIRSRRRAACRPSTCSRAAASSSASARRGCEQEWDAVGLDFATRGRRVDEAIEVCRRLWTEPTVSHHGEFFDFDEVAFEPKPIQQPWPPILVGGESKAALRRAARLGDGWLGMGHTLRVRRARRSRRCADCSTSTTATRATLRDRARRPGATTPDDVERWEALGVTRLIVSPWRRSKEAVAGVQRLRRHASGQTRSVDVAATLRGE